VPLGGWLDRVEANHVYTFPDGFALEGGASATVHTGSGPLNRPTRGLSVSKSASLFLQFLIHDGKNLIKELADDYFD